MNEINNQSINSNNNTDLLLFSNKAISLKKPWFTVGFRTAMH